jgi:predicted NBD/HSP70 family sugar kinase
MLDGDDIQGCGPLILPLANAQRPLRQQVFEHVRALGKVPRVQVAKDLRVSPASVTTITSDLIEQGFLEEVQAPRAEESGPGRPAVALRVRPGGHHVMGLKLSDKRHTAVIADLSGRVLAEAAVERLPGPLTVAGIADVAESLLHEVCAQAGLTAGDVRALGLGVPGFVDGDTGVLRWSPIMASRDIDLAPALVARLGVPVKVDNDANLVTLAELWFGAGREVSDFAVVTIENGIGMGFVMNHKLFRGSGGVGLELGHTKVHLDGALCRCGQRGCLEAYVADYALVREARTALDLPDLERLTVSALLERLYEHAMAGNPAARSIFRRAGRYLALALANVANLFDPQLIILSGERTRYGYLYAEETLAEMQTMMTQTGRTAGVEIHAWGDMVWAQGAAALALQLVTEEMLGA